MRGVASIRVLKIADHFRQNKAEKIQIAIWIGLSGVRIKPGRQVRAVSFKRFAGNFERKRARSLL